ncbi:hypothetical protein FQN60_007298 [Etheostoma spectabile]|uniref:Uncharacterized protein n=1 Tax=Etheostoma spectabile TaxID=54343 RepID=A0A5J5CDC6_9PERO|nr:hypothetical protein FQN60_007298 [Etheostoma spectabile]
MNLKCRHIPEMQPIWSVQKYKVFSAQRRDPVETPRLGQEISEDRFFKGFMD